MNANRQIHLHFTNIKFDITYNFKPLLFESVSSIEKEYY